MGLMIEGKTPSEIYCGGSKVSEVWTGGMKVWPDNPNKPPRVYGRFKRVDFPTWANYWDPGGGWPTTKRGWDRYLVGSMTGQGYATVRPDQFLGLVGLDFYRTIDGVEIESMATYCWMDVDPGEPHPRGYYASGDKWPDLKVNRVWWIPNGRKEINVFNTYEFEQETLYSPNYAAGTKYARSFGNYSMMFTDSDQIGLDTIDFGEDFVSFRSYSSAGLRGEIYHYVIPL